MQTQVSAVIFIIKECILVLRLLPLIHETARFSCLSHVAWVHTLLEPVLVSSVAPRELNSAIRLPTRVRHKVVCCLALSDPWSSTVI